MTMRLTCEGVVRAPREHTLDVGASYKMRQADLEQQWASGVRPENDRPDSYELYKNRGRALGDQHHSAEPRTEEQLMW